MSTEKINSLILLSYSNQISMILAQKQKQDQWKWIESPDTNPHIYSLLTYDKGGRNIQ